MEEAHCSLSLPLNHNWNPWEKYKKKKQLFENSGKKTTHTHRQIGEVNTWQKTRAVAVSFLFVCSFLLCPTGEPNQDTVACSERKYSERKLPFWPKDRARGPFELRNSHVASPTHFSLSLLCPKGTHAALWWCRKLTLRESHLSGQRNHTKGSTGAIDCEGNLNEEKANCLYQGRIAGIRDYDALDIDSSHHPLQ